MYGAPLRIGIDLGGTKIEGVALGRDGAEVARRRIETPNNYEQTLLAIEGLISFLDDEASAVSGQQVRGSVGVGIPGTLSPATRLVKNSNSTWLNGQAFDKDLEAIMGRPIRVMNDANCFALSEATDGAGVGAAVVFGVILGTGGRCGHRGGGARLGRTPGNRRGVGPQLPPLAQGRRMARARLLLRTEGLPRDLRVRTRHGAGSRSDHRPATLDSRDRGQGGRR